VLQNRLGKEESTHNASAQESGTDSMPVSEEIDTRLHNRNHDAEQIYGPDGPGVYVLELKNDNRRYVGSSAYNVSRRIEDHNLANVNSYAWVKSSVGVQRSVSTIVDGNKLVCREWEQKETIS